MGKQHALKQNAHHQQIECDSDAANITHWFGASARGLSNAQKSGSTLPLHSALLSL